ncbi:hypothetical protein Salat_2887100 [Sesamum alatum]|uniref:Uncharacterized protein n=1 Tax=Sesamum alatum TaxID=300844 RepID=A0AAE2C802_9LAMI|nr:hypothetical protein Salat_2887100 [Sesamum alatum]
MPTAGQETPPLSQDDVLGSQPMDGVRMATNTNTRHEEHIGYQGRRNATLLGKRQRNETPLANVTSSSTPQQTVANVPPVAATNTIKWTKKPSITEVLENIRKNSKRRVWKP